MRHFLVLFSAMMPVAALAQDVAAATPAAPSPIASLLPILLIFVVFYFLLIKPQQKRMKEHQALLGALKRGDDVVTGGGIVGKVTKVTEGSDQITVKIAEGVEVVVLKATVTGLVSASKPAAAAPAEKKKAGNKNDNAVPSRESVANDN